MNFAKENVHAVDPVVVWDVTLYNLVHSCQHFRATCRLSHCQSTDNFKIAHSPPL